jgi:biopolymer transport protein ExbB
MSFIEAPFIAIRSFFEAGGNVLWAIFFVTMLMWTLILERFWYFRVVLPREISSKRYEWEHRDNRHSWGALRIRDLMISEVRVDARRFIRIIQVLMALLPLLGLLGTVTGMIQVFNIMAIAGTSNARLMASGVSAATIPTMAGLVAALSGFYPAGLLQRRATESVKLTTDMLTIH